MDCLRCKNLEKAFEFRVSKYTEARSAVYYRVSTELAAKKNVDMERARYDLEEHQLICAFAPRLYPKRYEGTRHREKAASDRVAVVGPDSVRLGCCHENL